MLSPKERAAAFSTWVGRLVELLADGRFRTAHPIPLTVAGRSYYPPDTNMPDGSVTPGVFERALSKG
jgi:hypothetical protein